MKHVKILTVTFSLMVSASLLFFPKDADACCGAAAAAINSQTSAQASQHAVLLKRIDNMKEKIKEAIEDSSNKITSTTKKAAELQVQQKKEIFDMKEKAAKNAVCQGGGKYNTSGVISKDNTQGKTIKAISDATRKDAANTSGGTVDQTVSNDHMRDQKRLVLKEHRKEYCSPEDKNAKYCKKVVKEEYQNADIKASHFLMDAYDKGKDKSVEKDVNASKLFYQYIVGSDSTTVIPAKKIEENDEAKQLRAKQLSLAAYGSLPKYILAGIQSERKRNTSQTKLGDLLGIDNLDNPSFIEVLNEYTTTETENTLKGYADEDGIEDKTIYYQEKNLKGIAFTNFMLVKQYVQMQELSALLASKFAHDLKPAYSSLQNQINKLAEK